MFAKVQSMKKQKEEEKDNGAVRLNVAVGIINFSKLAVTNVIFSRHY